MANVYEVGQNVTGSDNVTGVVVGTWDDGGIQKVQVRDADGEVWEFEDWECVLTSAIVAAEAVHAAVDQAAGAVEIPTWTIDGNGHWQVSYDGWMPAYIVPVCVVVNGQPDVTYEVHSENAMEGPFENLYTARIRAYNAAHESRI